MNYNFWQGEKVRLRAMELRDLDTFLKWNKDSECDRRSYEIPFPQSYEIMKANHEKSLTSGAVNDEFRWIIDDLQGNTVGTINTFACSHKNGTFKYGLGICRDCWRKGYGSEAVLIVLRYYFHELRYQKAMAHVYSFNEGSIGLHKSLGFKLEGTLRKVKYTNGRYYDELVFGMLKEEFDEYHGKKFENAI